MAIPSFRMPPVSEVAAGLQFAPLPVQTRHFGQFWTEVAEEYPITQDVPPVPEVGETPTVQLLLLPPLRRVLLLSRDRQFLIQLQDSRFHCNWRKLRPDAVYPRFPVVFENFLRQWGRFSDFLKRQGLPEPVPSRYELTYVNEIETRRDSAASDIEQHVRMYVTVPTPEFLPLPSSVGASWQFVLPEGKGQMNANLSHVRKPDNRDAIVLALTCFGTASSKAYSISDWFATAHEWIVRGFADLTTPEAQRRWEREQ